MNWGRGSFRVWALLSVLWLGTVGWFGFIDWYGPRDILKVSDAPPKQCIESERQYDSVGVRLSADP